MRILYCNKYNFRFSGTEVYLFDAMEMMRRKGNETALFSMLDPRGEPTPYDHHFIKHIDFKRQAFARRALLALRASYSFEARRKLRGIIREFRPDLAHVRNIYHHLTPSILWELKARNIPVVYHMNDFKILCPSYNMVSRQGQACEKCSGGSFFNVVQQGCYAGGTAAAMVLAFEAYLHRWLRTYDRCVDVILAPSCFVKQKLIQNGWNPRRVEVLPHFQEAPEQVLPHPGATGFVLYLGRISREKGVSDVLAAAEALPNLKFVIAGTGPQLGELQTVAEVRNLLNVSFMGHVSGEKLCGLIAQSQFTVFPSHAYETMGKSILESYAHARAVIASDLGSRRELVEDGETGVLYHVGDTRQLVAAIRFLAARPQLADRMGVAGRERVLARHSATEHVLALSAIYERLHAVKGDRLQRPPARQPVRVAYIGGRGVIGKYSGVESFYEEAGRRLAVAGCEITAYCRTYFTPKHAEAAGVAIVRLPTIRTKHLETIVHTAVSTIHACFSNYDIVHFHTLGPALFSFLPRLFGKETLVTVQGLDWQRKKWSWFARRALRAGEWASAHFPNKTIVVSRALEQYYRSRYRCEPVYIPNGTEMREPHSLHCLGRMGLASGEYVLFLGRFSPEKNCDLMIEAFEKVDTTMKLVLAGGSSHTDAYVSRLRQHHGERVVFLDWLSGSDLDDVLTHAAIFVLPSDMEGLSLALLDAMGAGLCVLASDVPENREAVGDAGFLFQPRDKNDLRRMLQMLIDNPRLRSQAGREARERVRDRYLWDGVVSSLQQIYAELAGSPALLSKPEAQVPHKAA